MKTAKLNYNKLVWICTDPNTKQYGRQLTDVLFEFKEGDGSPQGIDLSGYENKEIEHIINSYGYTLMKGELKNPRLVNIHELYGKQANWVIAECMFESEQ